MTESRLNTEQEVQAEGAPSFADQIKQTLRFPEVLELLFFVVVSFCLIY